MQLKTDITAQFSQYEVVYPLVDFPPASPFAVNHFSAIQREHLALWCQGYLAAIQLNAKDWKSLPEFSSLTWVLRILEHEEIDPELLGIDQELPLDSPKVHRIVADLMESLPVLLGMIYDQACDIANPPKENNKPKKTDSNLLYHFRSGKIRRSLPNNEFAIQTTQH